VRRDTHELRLDHWPRLSTFPTTAAVIAAAVALDFLTFGAWFVLTLRLLPTGGADAATLQAVAYAAGTVIPDGWLLFLAGLHGIATTHFGIKRQTDFRRERKQKARPEVTP
jgi:hypothetical protein